MRVTLTHITAAYYWLMTTSDGLALEELERRGTLGPCPTRVNELYRFDLMDYQIGDLRPELLTKDSSSCPAPQRFKYHTCSRSFPAESFILLEGDIQIVSPELSFWQMSKILPLGELVKFGDALCGKYSYTHDRNGRPIRREVPLTTLKRLADFVHAMGSPRRNPTAFKALKGIVECAESPMESCSTILLCLKRQYGGFGLSKPIMGHVVMLDEMGKKLLGQESCRCDMYWPDANYDLEYDSQEEHGINQAEHDSLRRTAIRQKGIKIGELRRAQVVDAELFEMTAHLVAREIGERIDKRSEELEFKYAMAYLELRKQIFTWERKGTTMAQSPLCIGELNW